MAFYAQFLRAAICLVSKATNRACRLKIGDSHAVAAPATLITSCDIPDLFLWAYSCTVFDSRSCRTHRPPLRHRRQSRHDHLPLLGTDNDYNDDHQVGACTTGEALP